MWSQTIDTHIIKLDIIPSQVFCVQWRLKVLVAQLCPTLCDPMDCACQAPLSMGFSRQEYWSGLPFLPPGDIPDPGIKALSPALAGGFFTPEPSGKPT